jgi:hypothetical protein
MGDWAFEEDFNGVDESAPLSSAASRAPSDEPSPPALSESLKNLHALARELADVPSEIREAPLRAARRAPPGLPGDRPHRLRRVLNALAWPGLVTLVCGAGAALISLMN